MCYLKCSEMNAGISWVSPQILKITHHLDFMVSAWWGLFQAFFSHCLIYLETCHEIHLACKSDLKRWRRTVTRLLAVSHSLYRNILQKICACLRWNRCQIWPKDMDQRLLPTHTTYLKPAYSWIALFLRKQSFSLCGCCIKYIF